MTPQLALVLLVLGPAVVGVVLALAGTTAGPGGRAVADRAAFPVAVATAAVALGLAALAAAGRPSAQAPFLAGAPLGLSVDGLSAVVVPAVAAVVLLVLVFAWADVREGRARFAGLMLLFTAAVSLTATATTLPALLLAWEVMGAASYALVGFWWREDRRVSAGTTAFVTTRAGDLGLYVALAGAVGGGLLGGGSSTGMGLALADLAALPPGWRDVVAAGVLVAALGKAAQLPFSWWLSRAMEGPSPVSALLHSAAMVAMGGYLLLRVEPLLAATGWAATAAAWVGALTAVALGVVALAQRDLKQLLAASTSAQLGFVVLAAGVGAVTGGTAQLVAHAAVKALLFLVAGAWLTALGTKQLAGLRGAAGIWPVVGGAAAMGALALAGVPPFALWTTKDAVLHVALETSPALYAVGLLGAALSAAYAGKVLVVVFRRAKGGEEVEDVVEHWDGEEQGTREVPRLAQAPLVVLALAALGLAVLGLPPEVGRLAGVLEQDPAAAGAGVLELVVSGMVAFAALAAVVLLVRADRLPEPAWARAWLGLGAATDAVVRWVLALAERAARADDALGRGAVGLACGVVGTADAVGSADDRLDAGVRGLAGRADGLAGVVTRADDGVDRAVHGVATGTKRLGGLARRVQTGQLHDYYAQLVVVLGAAAVGLVLYVSLR
ncbi:proton-conducting transporter membrane subunit [uncultured Pseudokineococcus sp.]|uniref:proton-conducting transporter transmembrane domain-containing protein n=1 Tax=uncultured Pseudokineococcus sp. TaxID=1642928 RepID=UPI00260BDAFD|nr:proton-conducting transporter membrane subunit [uncultured Pseudokineococcus sp.]